MPYKGRRPEKCQACQCQQQRLKFKTASKGSSSREFLVLDSFLLNCISLKAILAEDTDHNPIKPHRKQVLANTEAVPNAGRGFWCAQLEIQNHTLY